MKTSNPSHDIPKLGVPMLLKHVIKCYILVGGIPTPLKNMKVSWDNDSQYIYIWKNKKMFQTTNQYIYTSKGLYLYKTYYIYTRHIKTYTVSSLWFPSYCASHQTNGLALVRRLRTEPTFLAWPNTENTGGSITKNLATCVNFVNLSGHIGV